MLQCTQWAFWSGEENVQRNNGLIISDFPSLKKDRKLHVQGVRESLEVVDKHRESTPRHVVTKRFKPKDQEKEENVLEATREKQLITLKGWRVSPGGQEVGDIFKMTKEKTVNQALCAP